MPRALLSSTDFQRSLEHRALDERGVEHAGKPHVDAVGGATKDLIAVSSLQRRLAVNDQSFASLSLDVRGGGTPAACLTRDRA